MMSYELNLPQSAVVNKYIAKSKFYERATISTKLRNQFINRLKRITWKYKLSKDTIGIDGTDKVTEIQIFEIELKEQKIPKSILKVIDKTIPYQILYVFRYNDDTAYGITLKEKTTVDNYYFSHWNENVKFDFSGINLEKVYEKLVTAFVKDEAKTEGNFQEIVDKDAKIKQLENEIVILENKIKREKQFNRKVEINKELLDKQTELSNFL
jgi:hypothetical protein